MILVTGGAGYAGSHFLKYIFDQDQNAEVVVADNLSIGHKKALCLEKLVAFEQVDLGDRQQLDHLFCHYPIDAVVHFAASAYVEESEKDPFKYLRNNVGNSLNLFQCMDEHNIKKIVFSSSCTVYGAPQFVPITEDHSLNPINTYGLTKLIIEQMLASLARTKNWSYIALRYFNAAGADETGQIGESHAPEPHLIPRILQCACGKLDSVVVHGNDYDTIDGTCLRDYIHVNDLARAHRQALDLVNRDSAALSLNLGTAIGATVLQVIETARRVTGKEIDIKIGPRRLGDAAKLVAHYNKAEAILNWQPQKSLTDIISSAWQWEKNRLF